MPHKLLLRMSFQDDVAVAVAVAFFVEPLGNGHHNVTDGSATIYIYIYSGPYMYACM